MSVGRRLAFDYGSVRVGVASTDFHAILATPLNFITNDEKLEDSINELLNELQPTFIAVGLPKHLTGTQGSKYFEVMAFVDKLKDLTKGPIYGIDERFTTVSASGKLKETGRDSKSSKELIDSAAAVEILESALLMEKSGELANCEL